jgi:uncharacterized protein (TIGR02246 family)
MTRLFATTILAVTMTTSIYGVGQAVPLAQPDATQIREALKGMDDAWNRHDMTAFVSYMADNVEWVNVVGMWWKGKAEVYQAHDAFHRTIFKNRQLHEPESIELKLVASDCVLATIIAKADGFTTPSGHVEPPGRSVLTEVFVKRGGKWLVVQGHNTTIVEEAQRSNPVK